MKEPTIDPIVAIVIALIVIAAPIAIGLVVRSRRRTHLRERFGSEYDRTVDRANSTRAAERDLAERDGSTTSSTCAG